MEGRNFGDVLATIGDARVRLGLLISLKRIYDKGFKEAL